MTDLIAIFIMNIVGWFIFAYFVRDHRANGRAVHVGRAILIGLAVSLVVLGCLLTARAVIMRTGEELPGLALLFVCTAGVVPLVAMGSLCFPFVSTRRPKEQ